MAVNRSFRVFRDGADMGTFTGQQLQEFARQGTLVASDEIEQVGSNQRCRADQLRGLGFVGSVASPAAPGTGSRRRVSAPPPSRPTPVYQEPAMAAGTGAAVGADPFAFGTGPSAGGPGTRVGARSSSSQTTVLIVLAAVGGFVFLAGAGAVVYFVMSTNYVRLVQQGRLEVCKDRTVGEMTTDFMERPRWKTFKRNGKRYVTCTGGIQFQGDPATATITFLITGKERFRVSAVEIDGDEMTEFGEAVFLAKLCSN